MESYRSQGITKVNFPALQGTGVKSYTIPSDGNFIQLPPQVDFKGWTIIAENHKYNGTVYVKCPLFSIEKWSNEQKTDFHLTKADVDRGDYRMCPELCSGKKLLVLTDQKEWTYRTDGNDTGPFLRHDIITLNDGVPENRPIAPWNTPSTALSYYYYEANNDPVVIENLTFKRYLDPGYMGNNVPRIEYEIAKLIRVDGKYDVTFRNITVEFANNRYEEECITRTGDLCFEIYNSAHVKFENITVNGTYSATNAYGYAFYLDNVYDTSFHNVYAMGLWGVIGTRNLNRSYLKDCTMNRMDIHCYGRDVRCVDCSFINEESNVRISNDYSSLFGSLHYERCIFRKSLPVYLAADYHAYSGFDLVMDSCTLDYPNHSGCIIKAGYIETPEKKRPEFQKINWPNVHIINLTLSNFPSNPTLYLFKLLSSPVSPSVNTIGYITQASVNFSTTPSSYTFNFSNYSSSLVFDNALTLQSTQSDISFSDM